MRKRGAIFLILLFSLALVSASEIDEQIQKLTYSAEEYETGNINYVQLLVYISAVREGLNEMFGASSKEMGGIIKEEQLKNVLGEPAELTGWVWVEESQHEKKLDEDIPVWKKIVFDGKKIQIRLAAFPSLYKNEIIYRLNFETEFKKPEDQMDVKGRIDDIKALAEEFNADSSSGNAEELAKESVNAERAFESYFRMNGGKCENLMAELFGAENKREAQHMLVYEIQFSEGDNFEAILRLELCDECEWNWVNMNLNLESRGRMPREKEGSGGASKEEFMSMETGAFESETKSLIENIKSSLEKEDFGAAMSYSEELNMLTQAWNEKSNDVWKQIDKDFSREKTFSSPEEEREFNENYGWIKEEQERRSREKELRNLNYQERKAFYLDLFADYEKKEFYFEQTEYQKRLVEEFKERGEEICDNGKDDNENGQIDCADAQCGGKICGKSTRSVVSEGNGSSSEEVELYCISNECTEKEWIKEAGLLSVCGNNICEEGEKEEGLNFDGNGTLGGCPGDCILCESYDSINCSGRVIFSGKNEMGCPLAPVCVEENLCENDEDCEFLCGKGVCTEGKCEVAELTECGESECTEGQEKVMKCGEQEIVQAICSGGLWENLEIECGAGEMTEEVTEEIAVVGEECSVKSDCGGEDDVCSNGKCVTLPENSEEGEEGEVVAASSEGGEEETEDGEEETEDGEEETEDSEEGVQESPAESESDGVEEPEQSAEESSEPESAPEVSEPESSESSEESSEPEITGNVILGFFLTLGQRLGITGFSVEDGGDTSSDSDSSDSSSDSSDSTGDESVTVDNYVAESEPDSEDGEDFSERQDGEFVDGGGEIMMEGSGGNYEDDNREEYRDDRREEDNQQRCGEECKRICFENEIRPCVEKCLREECGNEFDCNVEEVQKSCEGSCKGDTSGCEGDCVPKCTSGGEDWWKEFQREPEEEQWKEEKGVFQAGGGCRQAQGKTEGFIWFGGWGEPFGEIEKLKQKYYRGGHADWCKWEMENLARQRKEFEEGFNQEFVTWFFEQYLADSAEDWEKHVSGIFELYWKDVEMSKQMAERMQCLGTDKFPETNLINVKYETEYGMIEFWEEKKTVKFDGMEKEVELVSPYMKVWIFPSKEVFKTEMKSAMKKHIFPGSEGGQGSPSAEEKEEMKKDKQFMEWLAQISEKYGGSFDVALQFKDYEKDEVVFNLYIKMDEQNLVEVEPMPYDEVPAEDGRVELDFNKIYELVTIGEKDMQQIRTESPPWDKRKFEPVRKIKEVSGGARMWMKQRDLINSAKYYPESGEEDMKMFTKEMLGGMFGGPRSEPSEEERKEGDDKSGEIWEEKEFVTGEIILEPD